MKDWFRHRELAGPPLAARLDHLVKMTHENVADIAGRKVS